MLTTPLSDRGTIQWLVLFGQVPLAPPGAVSTAQAGGGSGASGRAPLRRPGCPELPASALGSSRRPLPAGTRRARGARGHPHARRVPEPQRDGPGAPGGSARASPAPSRRRRTAAGGRGANFYTYFLFRFGCGVALAPPRIETQTLIFHRLGTWPPSPRGLHQLFRRTKFSLWLLKKKVVPKSSSPSNATTMTTSAQIATS